MKEVIIYGGAFNPPTIAHQAIAQAAAEYAAEQNMELWLLPSGERYDKKIGVSVEKRLSYAHALLASLTTTTTTQVCDVELKRSQTTQTIDTMKILSSTYPAHAFTWLYGSDSVNSMNSWKDGEWIRQNVLLLVIRRPTFEVEDITENIHFLEVEQLATSSSEVRSRHKRGLSIESLVPASVLPLI